MEALKLEVNQALSFQEISKIQAKYSQYYFLGTSSQPLRPKKAISWKVKRFVFRDLTRNTSVRKSRIGRPRGKLNRMSVHHVQVKKGPLIKENVNPQSGKRKQPDESIELKLLQDLKSEAGNIRSVLQFVVNYINKNKGQKFGDSGKPITTRMVKHFF